MMSSPRWKLASSIIIVALLLVIALPAIASLNGARASHQQLAVPTIKIIKRVCDGRDVLPVFVESHCREDPDALFTIKDPRAIHVETLSSGQAYTPDGRYFAGSNLWAIEDVSPHASPYGVRTVSCVSLEPGSAWHSAVPRVVHSARSGNVLLDWMPVPNGVPGASHQPSIDCVWLELPGINATPAILSLQVYETGSPHLNWTEITGSRLPALPRGASGDDIEANMVMTNVETGDVYSFAADDYGQVLVPPGTYSLVDTASGLEEFFTMRSGETILVEIGLATPGIAGGTSETTETRTFSTGVLYCEGADCSPLGGVVIHYESMDNSISGSCVTEIHQTPNGAGAWCNYAYNVGVPTILTLDESSLPPAIVVTSENPQTYLVPVNPDGPLGPVYFLTGPA